MALALRSRGYYSRRRAVGPWVASAPHARRGGAAPSTGPSATAVRDHPPGLPRARLASPSPWPAIRDAPSRVPKRAAAVRQGPVGGSERRAKALSGPRVPLLLLLLLRPSAVRPGRWPRRGPA